MVADPEVSWPPLAVPPLSFSVKLKLLVVVPVAGAVYWSWPRFCTGIARGRLAAVTAVLWYVRLLPAISVMPVIVTVCSVLGVGLSAASLKPKPFALKLTVPPAPRLIVELAARGASLTALTTICIVLGDGSRSTPVALYGPAVMVAVPPLSCTWNRKLDSGEPLTFVFGWNLSAVGATMSPILTGLLTLPV